MSGENNQPSLSDFFNKENISTVVSSVSEMMGSNIDLAGIADQLTSGENGTLVSDMMEQFQKLAANGNAKQVVQEMQKQGLNPRQMRSDILAMQRLMKKNEPTTNVIMVCRNRKLKLAEYPTKTLKQNVALLLKTSDPVQAPCSRMAIKGTDTEGKTFHMWYNPDHKNRNRRASKLLGCPVGGDVIISSENYNLTLADFTNAESKYQ